MSTIGIGMLPEEGHLNPTLRLAHSLRARGHRICYFSIPDFEDWVTRHGFEFVPVFEDVFPRGALAQERKLTPEQRDAARTGLFAPYRDYVLSNALDQRLQSIPLDLILSDTLNDFLIMAAHHPGIPCVRLSTSLPQSAAAGIPPLSSRLPFGDTPERAAAVEQAWAEHLRTREQGDWPLRIALKQALQAKYGYPAEWLDWRSTFEPDLFRVPELILCTAALDFPRPPDPSRHFIESLWLERTPVDFPWHELDERKPSIYCSLGTHANRSRGARRWYGELFAAAASLPDYQFVVVIGEWLSRDAFAQVPDNAVVVPYAPQLSLLERCHLAITHGGLGTLKESLFFGKPVLVFPGAFDQFGNAARIAHHGLGLVGDFETVTAAELVTMIRQVLADDSMPQRIAAVRAALVELEQTQPGLALIEELLARA